MQRNFYFVDGEDQSGGEAGEGDTETPRLSLAQFWRFIKDTKCCQRALTCADFDYHFIEAISKDMKVCGVQLLIACCITSRIM